MKHTNAERFIRLWQETASVSIVSESLDVSKAAVYARLARYRAMGIKLRENEPPPRLDVPALKKLALSIR